MKKLHWSLVCAAGLFAMATTTAYAGEAGWYVLGAAGQLNGNSDKASFDNSLVAAGNTGFTSNLTQPTIYRLGVGYQFDRYYAVEGGYIGSSTETYTATGGTVGTATATAKLSGAEVKAVGILPFTKQFAMLVKLGLANIKDSTSSANGAVTASGTKTDLTYGIGFKYDMTDSLSLRADLDGYKVGSAASTAKTSVWTLGLAYKF